MSASFIFFGQEVRALRTWERLGNGTWRSWDLFFAGCCFPMKTTTVWPYPVCVCGDSQQARWGRPAEAKMTLHHFGRQQNNYNISSSRPVAYQPHQPGLPPLLLEYIYSNAYYLDLDGRHMLAGGGRAMANFIQPSFNFSVTPVLWGSTGSISRSRRVVKKEIYQERRNRRPFCGWTIGERQILHFGWLKMTFQLRNRKCVWLAIRIAA